MTAWVKASTWKPFAPIVKVGGTWTDVKIGYVRTGGSWTPFYPSISLIGDTVYDLSYGSTAQASIQANNDGYMYGLRLYGSDFESHGSTDWVLPHTAPVTSLYEIRATVTSGSLTSGTTGSWLALSSDRSWTVQQASIGLKTCTITLDIRDVATSTTVASASYTLTAQRVY